MKYTTLSDDDMDVVQKFAFGGIANPVQRPFLRAADREFLDARQAELDAFEAQRQAYNTGLTKYQEEVFKPYQEQAQAFNTAAQQYNTDVYAPYQQQFNEYQKAVADFNAGDRTADYAGPAEPTLARTFDMTAPTAPGAFDMSAPVLPFKEEEVVARQQAAAQTARRDAGNRATAINVVSNPEQFGFGSMSIANRFMAEGGPVDKDTGPSARDMLDDTPINTDPLGSAQQYMAQLTKADRPSPTRQSIKRVAKNTGGADAPKEMGMGLDPLASAKDLVPQLADKGSSRQQMEDFVRAYQLKMDAAKNKARGLSADTFGAPTLERASLTKNTLAKKRFAKGGEAKKSDAEVAEPSLFGVSKYATRTSAKMFPDQLGQDDQRDAARHMLAAGSVARKYGPKAAELLGKAHEYTSNPQTFFSMFGIGEPRDDLPYDVHNNQIGAELAARATSQADLERLVKELALRATTEQTKGKPYIMSREKMDARKAKALKGPAPRPEYGAKK